MIEWHSSRKLPHFFGPDLRQGVGMPDNLPDDYSDSYQIPTRSFKESIKSESGITATSRSTKPGYKHKKTTNRTRSHSRKARSDRVRIRSARFGNSGARKSPR